MIAESMRADGYKFGEWEKTDRPDLRTKEPNLSAPADMACSMSSDWYFSRVVMMFLVAVIAVRCDEQKGSLSLYYRRFFETLKQRTSNRDLI